MSRRKPLASGNGNGSRSGTLTEGPPVSDVPSRSARVATLPGRRIADPNLDALAPAERDRRAARTTKSRDAVDRVQGEVFGRPSGIRSSAGRVLGVGLLCFLLWTLFDANQLYREALGSPDGARRTVAVTVLRPIAAVSNLLHLSGIVNWGDSVLGRNGTNTVGQNQTQITVPTIPTGTVTSNVHRLSDGMIPLPHRPGVYQPPASGPSFVVPPIPPPTLAHPLTILDIGDSVGEDLGFGLGDIFTGDRYVNVLQKGVEDTGLDQPNYWNWPGHLYQYLQQYHPRAVVIMMGANDDQNLNQKGSSPSSFCASFGPPCVVPVGTHQWTVDYTARVRLLMEESLLAGAHVIWVGQPPMGGGNVTSAFCQQINAIAEAQARSLPGVAYVSSWNVLGGSHGQFVLYKNGAQIRSNDGIHLDPAGWDLLAHALVKPMQQAWHINLHVGS